MSGRVRKWSEVVAQHVAPIWLRQPKASYCGCGHSKWTLGVDGSVHACHHTAGTAVGNLDACIDAASASPWVRRDVANMPGCTDCAYRHICMGGCRARNKQETGSALEHHEATCFFKRVRTGCALRIIEAIPRAQLDGICARNTTGSKVVL